MRHVSLGLDELTTRAYDLVAAGELVRARAVLEDGLAETEFDGTTVPPDLAEAASLYARVLLACGETEAARDWATYAHGAAERLHGAADQRTVRDAATLAATQYRIGELPAAERLYRDVVAQLSAQDGPGAPQTLAARADLATVLHATGQCRAARSELAGALAAHQAGYGLQEPAGIRMLARLAAMSRDCGDEAAAQRHFARARALAETYLPAEHPVAGQVAALAAAPANPAHPCQLAPPVVGPAEQEAQWWPPEQDGDPTAEPPPAHNGRAASGAGPDGGGLAARPLSRGHLAAPRRIPPLTGRIPFADPAPHAPPADTVPSDARREPPHTPAESPHTPPSPPEPGPGPGPGRAVAPRPDPRLPVPDPANAYSIAPAHPYSGLHLPPPEPARSRWAGMAFGAGLAVLGIAGGWFAATTLMAAGDEPAAPPTPAKASPATPTPADPPPTGLTLRDSRDRVTLSWSYPGGAEGPVLVAGGRTGEQQRAFQTLAPGTTTYTVYGLAERADYCFTVAVIYSTEVVARSAPACTTREGAASSPTKLR